MTNPKLANFVDELARVLTEDEARKSIGLELGHADALIWRRLRQHTPLFGYYTGDDGYQRARSQLRAFIGLPADPHVTIGGET